MGACNNPEYDLGDMGVDDGGWVARGGSWVIASWGDIGRYDTSCHIPSLHMVGYDQIWSYMVIWGHMGSYTSAYSGSMIIYGHQVVPNICVNTHVWGLVLEKLRIVQGNRWHQSTRLGEPRRLVGFSAKFFSIFRDFGEKPTKTTVRPPF